MARNSSPPCISFQLWDNLIDFEFMKLFHSTEVIDYLKLSKNNDQD